MVSKEPAAVPGTSAGAAVVNDFSINVATVNGTGSQTANLTLLRALFKMGIPVNGKNIFPSNIQGLPTWYQIRVSKDGYEARRESHEILVAFNEATVAQDLAALPAGGVCLINGDWRGAPRRPDAVTYSLPVNQFLRQAGVRGRLKEYLSNMVYVGALAALLDIQPDAILEALGFHFRARPKLVEGNWEVVRLAYDWVCETQEKRDPYRVAPLDATVGKILMTGNEAAGLGSVFGGVSFVSWYPITPSTSLIEAVDEYLGRLRRDPDTGAQHYTVVQAEDELAAIGMVVGAGWAGSRAMTATSGPGLSLMAEFAGLAYFAEIPSVIWDVQRVGPSTGLPTRTSQGDVTFAYYLGHGDTRNILLFPGTVAECFAFGTTAFDLADELQTLVLVMSDLDLGMNNWMSEPFPYPDKPLQRGKIVTAEQLAAGDYGRYRDVDGDGIPARSLPGNPHPLAAWLARGTGHNDRAVYSESPTDWSQNMARLRRKFETARRLVPAPVIEAVPDAAVGLIAYGSSHFAVQEARDRLAEAGIATSFLRLRALPINDQVRDFVAAHRRVYVVELNRDGQLHAILQTELPDLATRLRALNRMDGLPLTASWLTEACRHEEETA
jgi:2-oxoglutarate ferredoxin oxidoreductase subunit alpha